MSGTTYRNAAALAAGLTAALALLVGAGELTGLVPVTAPGIEVTLGVGILALTACVWLCRGSGARASRNDQMTLDVLLGAVSEAIFVVDADDTIRRVNGAAAKLVGTDLDKLVGAQMRTLMREDETIAGGPPEGPQDLEEARLQRADGSTLSVEYRRSAIRDDTGAVQSVVYAVQSIDERKRVEQRVRFLAQTDPLTKIANRTRIQYLLQRALARARRDGHYLALLYLDVDRFKDINDTFGHATGDASLEMFANRIVKALPQDAVPGRLASDEFCIVLPGSERLNEVAEHAGLCASQLLRSVGRPFELDGEEIFMSTSIGIALFPRDGDAGADLLRNADAALHQAKQAGGNCFEFYSARMNSLAAERLMLKSKLRRAFERDELRLHYQPKYRLADGRISGAEALVRWDLPERGLVFPGDFIPLAEETNLILQIGEWVLDRVCADYRLWQRAVPSPCRVSVNLSLRQLQQQRFLEGVRQTFKTHAVSPTCLEFEITETTLMEDARTTIKVLESLYGMGLHLAIDDFGTGYSSLSALRQFPISTLKIDQAFVRDLGTDQDSMSIVRSIIQMAHSLKLEVVAEGVEAAEQLEFLRRHGCDYAQGHLFGDSVTADAFSELLVADAEGSARHRVLFGR